MLYPALAMGAESYYLYIDANNKDITPEDCIKNAAARICSVFSHSPVFRMGGDEFLVILTGEDYEKGEILMKKINTLPKDRSQIKIGDVISAGIAKYDEEQQNRQGVLSCRHSL